METAEFFETSFQFDIQNDAYSFSLLAVSKHKPDGENLGKTSGWFGPKRTLLVIWSPFLLFHFP